MAGTFRYTLGKQYDPARSDDIVSSPMFGARPIGQWDEGFQVVEIGPYRDVAGDGSAPPFMVFRTAASSSPREVYEAYTKDGVQLPADNASYFFSLEGLTFGGTLRGGGLGDRLVGGNGADVLAGGAGDDILDGGRGIDTAFYGDGPPGVTVDLALGFAIDGFKNRDTLRNIENVVGSMGDDTFHASRAANHIDGGIGGGTDTVSYAASTSLVSVNLLTGTGQFGYAGGDTLVSIENAVGSAFDDEFVSGFEKNWFDGGSGSDTLNYADSDAALMIDLTNGWASGGTASGDTFVSVENVIGTRFADTILASASVNRFAAGDGLDTVSYAAASAGVDADLSGGGKRGDAKGDVYRSVENLMGSRFADTLTGNNGANALLGLDGDDMLDGGSGADTMWGGNGGDTYVVDNRADTIWESAGCGVDTVLAQVSYRLAAHQEVEVLRAASPKSTAAVNLYGNEFAQALVGNGGRNWLDGGAGNDVLRGGWGNDTFAFTAKVAGDVDTITDFTNERGNNDRIVLDNDVFTKLLPGRLLDVQFTANRDGVAKDSLDRIVYETDTGKLLYDCDGSGAGTALHFATLANKVALTAGDFLVL